MDELPFDDRHVPRVEVDWERSAWWWRPLTRAIQPAVKINALILGTIGLCIAQAGVYAGYWLFRPNWSGLETAVVPEPEAFRSVAVGWIVALAQAVVAFESFGIRELAFATFTGLWLATVFALVGGLLARRSMVELGQQTIAPWGESVRIVFGRLPSFVWSTGMHFVSVVLLLIPALIAGAISRLGTLGASIGAILLLLAFPLVFGIGRLALSMFISFPLSNCAIVAEKNADAFEGFSRANAYLYQRPAVAVITSLILFFVGFIGEQFVYWTLTLGWTFMEGAYSIASASPEASEPYLAVGKWLTSMLICAFWFSYFWSASAALYLILRKSVDHAEFDELDAIVNPIEQTLPEIPITPPTSANSAADEDVAPNAADESPPSS